MSYLSMKRKKFGAFAFAAALLWCAPVVSADEAACLAGLHMAAGKYALCSEKAAADGFDDEKFLKCRQKYASAWPKLGAKNPGTSCAGARLEDNGDGTVTDHLTRLVWEKKDSLGGGANLANPHDADNIYSLALTSPNADGTAYTDFLASLNSTAFAGQSDWRLPTLYELQTTLLTIAVPCGIDPCMDPIFGPAPVEGDYWTTTTVDPYVPGHHAFFVTIDLADSSSALTVGSSGVRAVRGGW